MTAIARVLLLLPLLAFACDKAEPSAGDKPETTADATADAHAKIVGVWIEQDDTGEIYTLTADRFDAVYPKIENANPMNGPYSIVKVDGAKVTIKPTLELPNGKSMAADEQVITIIDDDTIDRRNAKNNSGGVFKRKKA